MLDFGSSNSSCDAKIVKVNLDESDSSSPQTEAREARSTNQTLIQKPLQGNEKAALKTIKSHQDRLKNSENYKTAVEIFSNMSNNSVSIQDQPIKYSHVNLIDPNTKLNRKWFSPDRNAESERSSFAIIPTKKIGNKSIKWNTENDFNSKNSECINSKYSIPEFSFTPSHQQLSSVKTWKSLINTALQRKDESRNKTKRLMNYQSEKDKNVNVCLAQANIGKSTFELVSTSKQNSIKPSMSTATLRNKRKNLSNTIKFNNSVSNISKEISELEAKSSGKSKYQDNYNLGIDSFQMKSGKTTERQRLIDFIPTSISSYLDEKKRSVWYSTNPITSPKNGLAKRNWNRNNKNLNNYNTWKSGGNYKTSTKVKNKEREGQNKKLKNSEAKNKESLRIKLWTDWSETKISISYKNPKNGSNNLGVSKPQNSLNNQRSSICDMTDNATKLMK